MNPLFPRRSGSLFGSMLAAALLGGAVFDPRVARNHVEPTPEPMQTNEQAKFYLDRAEARRNRRSAKRLENARRTEEGKRRVGII